MGRTPLDEQAIRLIEKHHPEIRFDWPQILKGEEETAPVHAALRQLGSEGLARLRARYAEVISTIARRVPDPKRREELKAEAERLNPDRWAAAADVDLGLEQYEAVLESLRDILGQHRRRRRSRQPETSGAPQPAGGSG
ncbi:MAG: hypothetical protein ACRD15_10890, partial [Vicinamibacterales bacterium]